MNWLKYIAIFIAVTTLGLYLFIKFYVGAINTPFGEYLFDKSKMEQQIVLPEGFSIGVYASDIPNARLLLFTRTGDLLVANPNLDQIILLERDRDRNGKADSRKVLLADLNGPNGLDFYQGWLYIAETDAIGRVPFDHESGKVTGAYERLVTGLPGGGNHWKKTLRFGADGRMYVSMGSSCNVCLEDDERRASMVRYAPDGSGEEIFARGLRNSAGFDWSPRDGLIYATDNGRDLLGDDFPPCELNKVEQGRHYGWPYANGANIPDPDFGDGNESKVKSSTAPVHEFRPHNAPLGIAFISGRGMPEAYKDAAIVALHGSWNRSEKDGYKVVSLHWDNNGNIEERDFVTGFLCNDEERELATGSGCDEEVIGRPAEVAEGPDGAVYIADDRAGVVYRVAYGMANEQGKLSSLDVAAASSLTPKAVYNAEETLAAFDAEEKNRLSEKGRSVFEKYACASCHVQDSPALIKLAQTGSKYNIATLSAYLAAPTAPMPVFPMTDEEKQALAVFLIQNH